MEDGLSELGEGRLGSNHPHSHYGSMEMVYLPTVLVDFMVNVDKYTSPMDPMGFTSHKKAINGNGHTTLGVPVTPTHQVRLEYFG